MALHRLQEICLSILKQGSLEARKVSPRENALELSFFVLVDVRSALQAPCERGEQNNIVDQRDDNACTNIRWRRAPHAVFGWSDVSEWIGDIFRNDWQRRTKR